MKIYLNFDPPFCLVFGVHYKLSNKLHIEVQLFNNGINILRNVFYTPDESLVNYLNEDMCRKIITKYLDEVCFQGEYYPITRARKIIYSSNYPYNIQVKMIELLDATSQKRNFNMAKLDLFAQGYSENYISELIMYFNDLYVNPVSIPLSWKIKQLRSLNMLINN